MRQALICLFSKLLERSTKMFFRFIMLGISFVVILFIFYMLSPILEKKYRLHKEQKARKKRKKQFKKTMKKLEII